MRCSDHYAELPERLFRLTMQVVYPALLSKAPNGLLSPRKREAEVCFLSQAEDYSISDKQEIRQAQ